MGCTGLTTHLCLQRRAMSQQLLRQPHVALGAVRVGELEVAQSVAAPAVPHVCSHAAPQQKADQPVVALHGMVAEERLPTGVAPQGVPEPRPHCNGNEEAGNGRGEAPAVAAGHEGQGDGQQHHDGQAQHRPAYDCQHEDEDELEQDRAAAGDKDVDVAAARMRACRAARTATTTAARPQRCARHSSQIHFPEAAVSP